ADARALADVCLVADDRASLDAGAGAQHRATADRDVSADDQRLELTPGRIRRCTQPRTLAEYSAVLDRASLAELRSRVDHRPSPDLGIRTHADAGVNDGAWLDHSAPRDRCLER